MQRTCLWWLCVIFTQTIACGDVDRDHSDLDHNQLVPDAGQPQTPRLDEGHEGWGNPGCDSCHTLPVEHHYQTARWQCAGCHGGNGACDPTHAVATHARSQDCLSCHDPQHGFSGAQECVQCHFAFAGLRDCTLRARR